MHTHSIEDTIRQMIAPMPTGSAVMLPVDWLRTVLDGAEVSSTAAAQASPALAMDYTIGQVATLIGRKPSTVRGWCGAGLLTAYRLNNRDWRIPADALQEFQRTQREQQHSRRHHRQGRRRTNEPVDLQAWRRVTAG